MSKRKFGSPPRKSGGQVKHGAYSIIYREEVVKLHPQLVRYVQDSHDALLRDLAPGGPETLSAARRLLLDRLTSKLLMAGLLDIYLGEHGVLRKDRLGQKPPVAEAEPIVQTWLSVNTSILKDLLALGLDRQSIKPRVVSPQELMVEVAQDIEAEEEATRKRAEKATDPTGGAPGAGEGCKS